MNIANIKKPGIRGALALFVLTCGSAYAQFTVTINLSEGGGRLTNSGGTSLPLPCAMTADPGPGGALSAFFCNTLNPPGLVDGDLVVMEPNGTVSDLLRFNHTIQGGGLFIYSDNSDGVDSPADIAGIPTGRNANVITIIEVGPEGNNAVTYTPTAGQPGFVAGAGGPVTYVFVSDGNMTATKTFGELAIPVGGSTSLMFSLTNSVPIPLTGVGFGDILPAGLVVSTPNGLTGSCGGGTITAAAGTNLIALAGASLATGATCTFTVNVTGTAVGIQNNTMMVSSTEGVVGNATASIFVGATNVTSRVMISVAGFLPDRGARQLTDCTVITVMNPSTPPDRNSRATTIAGPIEVVLTSISPNAILVSPTGTLIGNPFVQLQPLSLPPGGSVSAPLCFLNPTGAPIIFTPRIYSGQLF